MSFTTDPNMGFPVPQVSGEPGPQYASDVNQALSIIGAHNHLPGFGVPVPSQALLINSDLSFGTNNAINMRSVRFVSTTATSGTDIGCIYVKGVDLYFNDLNANVVRITAQGGLSTTGLSAGLVSSTAFISANATGPVATTGLLRAVNNSDKIDWRNAANNGDDQIYFDTTDTFQIIGAGGLQTTPVKIIDPIGGKVISLVAPQSTSAYTAILPINPPLAASSSFPLVMSSSGSILAQPITRQGLPAVNQQISNSSGNYSTTSGSYTPVTNMSVTITTTGRPVLIFLQPDGTTNVGGISASANSFAETSFKLFRGATLVALFNYQLNVSSSLFLCPSQIFALDTPSAGTYTYSLQVQVAGTGGTPNAAVFYCVMVAYEL